jgi:uncharacterized protein DUF2652
MSVERGLLFIADIGGDTRFMKLHEMSLAHAQDHIARLLEAVIEASPTLKLIELEGDAAFFYRPLSGDFQRYSEEPALSARHQETLRRVPQPRGRLIPSSAS